MRWSHATMEPRMVLVLIAPPEMIVAIRIIRAAILLRAMPTFLKPSREVTIVKMHMPTFGWSLRSIWNLQ